MEKNQIHRLLEKYFEGNTSLKEEKDLRDYFSGSDINNPEWTSMKRQFDLLISGQGIHFDISDLESGILKSIDDYERQHNPPLRKSYIIRYLVAASVSIAFILSGILLFRTQHTQIADTYSDPQLAYAETQKTLLFISQKMNDGMKPLNHINRINSGTQQLKNLEKMDKSMGMLNLVSFINQSSNLKK